MRWKYLQNSTTIINNLLSLLYCLCKKCLAVPVRHWAELDFILAPIPASTEPTGGVCATGISQSPIDLSLCTVEKISRLRFVGHADSRNEGFTIKNTGHSAQISFAGKSPVINGGPLLEDYTLSQLHFHWGTADKGSEHSIEGTFYGLEGHFVHFKSSYGNVNEAVLHNDGLAVVGIMFELSSSDNPGLSDIITSLSSIQAENSTTTLGPSAMTWFSTLVTKVNYYTYSGSLTTSPCSEVVTWIVLKKKSHISLQQIAHFRQLLGPNGAILENRRPIQPLNNRVVKCEINC